MPSLPAFAHSRNSFEDTRQSEYSSPTLEVGPNKPDIQDLSSSTGTSYSGENSSVLRFFRWLKWRAGADMQCHWSQRRIAEEFEVTIRTVQRWVSRLLQLGAISVQHRPNRSAITVIRKSSISDRSTARMSGPMSPPIRDKEVRKSSEPYAGCSDTTNRSQPAKKPMAIALKPNAEFVSYVRSQIDFEIGGYTDCRGNVVRPGQRPDEGTAQRIAGILGDSARWPAFRDKFVAWNRRNKAESWGIAVLIAKDVAAEAS